MYDGIKKIKERDLGRRDFLAVGALGIVGIIRGEFGMYNFNSPFIESKSESPRSQKFKRICISSWAFNRWIRPRAGKGAVKLILLDFPKFIIDNYGVKNLELCQVHFASTDENYLNKLTKAVFESGFKVRNIPCDIRINLSNPVREARLSDVETAKEWVDIAKYVGSPSIRYNVGRGTGTDEEIKATIDLFTILSDYGAEKNIKILIENHGGGIATDYRNLLKIFKTVDSPFLEPLNDIANYPNAEDSRKGIREFFAISGWICHIKRTRHIELEEALKIVRESGFHGYCSIEGIMGGEDIKEGVREMINIVLRGI